MPSFRSGILSRPGHTPYLPRGRVFVAWRFENSPSDLFFAGMSFTRTGLRARGVTCMSCCMRIWWGRPWRRSDGSWIIWTSPLIRPVWPVLGAISEDHIIGLAVSRSTPTTQTTGPSWRPCWRKQIKHTLLNWTNICQPFHLIFQNQVAQSR